MQGAEDDDSWMRDGADDLERELAAREKEMAGPGGASTGNGFDPENLAQRFTVCCLTLLSAALTYFSLWVLGYLGLSGCSVWYWEQGRPAVRRHLSRLLHAEEACSSS